jgi:lysophospholipase L1-like esterase
VRALLVIAAAAVIGAALAPSPAGGAGDGSRSAYLVGDSLASGTAVYLRDFLQGWRVQQDVRVGRQADAIPGLVAALGERLPRVVLVSAGTNGSPTAVSAFTRDVRAVLELAGPKRCVIWANVVRPPVAGTGYGRLNRTLSALAQQHPSLVVFDWAALVRAHRNWLRADGVHAGPSGYRARARALAALATRCTASAA